MSSNGLTLLMASMADLMALLTDATSFWMEVRSVSRVLVIKSEI
jgi:hypothetical protein